MKKKLLFILLCMALISASSLIITSSITNDKTSSKTKIVTSFYPIYIIATNIVEGIDEIEVVNLTEYEKGCLHDYQLTTRDMKRLENADIIIMNGGGMEAFVEDIFDAYPNVPVIDSSTGIPLLSGTGHSHDEDLHVHEDDHAHDDHAHDDHTHDDHAHDDHAHDDHAHDDHVHDDHSHEYNAHVWMNTEYYIMQIENITEELSKLDPSNSKVFKDNSKRYIEEIRDLQSDIRTRLSQYKDIPIIIFHDAFAYLADEIGLNVVHIISMDENTHLSAGEIKEIIDKINKYNVKVLLTEEQYSVSIAETISSETASKTYIVDSIVTGPSDNDAYIKGMKKNLDILEEAYKEVLAKTN